MAIVAKALADGQLPNAKGTLYTTPAATVTYVKSIICHNLNTTDETMFLCVNRTGTSRVLVQAVLATKETLQFDEPLTLEAADIIEGMTTTASKVDYTISGAEEA